MKVKNKTCVKEYGYINSSKVFETQTKKQMI